MTAVDTPDRNGEERRPWIRRNVTDWLEAALAVALTGLLRLLPLSAASGLGGWFARTVGPRLSVSQRAERNLKLAMPHLDAAARRRIVRDMWDNMGRTVVELTQMARYGLPGDKPFHEFEGREHVVAAMAAKRPIACISGHYGNWEMPVLSGLALGMQVVRVYRTANNPIVDKLINRMRKPGGGRLLPKGVRGSRQLIAAARKGEPMGILFDQKLNEGETLLFFGHPANTTTLPAFLAVRFGYCVLPTRTVRIKGCHLRTIVEPPVEPPAEGTTEERITAMTDALNRVLERWIEERPGEWFWLHNRWGKWRGDTLVPAATNGPSAKSAG
ncbi:MAG: lysophospholipid acyltransferase family protein [Alphaproteobacteria bacterium]